MDSGPQMHLANSRIHLGYIAMHPEMAPVHLLRLQMTGGRVPMHTGMMQMPC